MFVTVGNRHVKFWYLDASKSKVSLIFCNSLLTYCNIITGWYFLFFTGPFRCFYLVVVTVATNVLSVFVCIDVLVDN